MTWRGSTSAQDRLFASLVYIIPMLDALPFGLRLLNDFFGISALIALSRIPLIQLYYLPFVPFAVFIALYVLVVRSDSIAHFIRFNTMQAILISILLSLFSIIWQYVLASILGGTIIEQTLFSTVFLGVVAASGYSILQSAMGRYAEIPTLSEAAYAQVRY